MHYSRCKDENYQLGKGYYERHGSTAASLIPGETETSNMSNSPTSIQNDLAKDMQVVQMPCMHD